jgi:drug/metabolite transporter (DMT)-like permease
MWVILLLVHLFANTGYNAVLRHAASDRKTDSLLLAAVMSTAIAVPASIGIAIKGIDFSSFDIHTAWGFAGLVAATLAFHILNAKALEHTEASVFTFLYNLRIAVASLLGILLFDEQINVLRLSGGALVFLAGFLIIGKVRANRKGVVLSVSTAVGIATVNMFEKWLIGEVGFTNTIFPSAVLISVILWASVLLRRTPISKSTLVNRSIIGLMPLRCASAYGFTLALSFGAMLSVSTYISSMSVITTSVAGILFLRERDLLVNKITAAAVALAGITLIFIANRV